jgi:hypothetical protein
LILSHYCHSRDMNIIFHGAGSCDGLNEKCPPLSQAFVYLISWWYCLCRVTMYGHAKEGCWVWGGGVGFESLNPGGFYSSLFLFHAL